MANSKQGDGGALPPSSAYQNAISQIRSGLNDEHAIDAAGAVNAYRDAIGAVADPSRFFSDLLCNLRHWADRNDKSWSYELFEAMEDYRFETEDKLYSVSDNPHERASRVEIPADPDQLNEGRAKAADVAMQLVLSRCHYVDQRDVAFQDLLCNLRHWGDQNGKIWDHELAQATEAYGIQTQSLGMSAQPEHYLHARGFEIIETGGGCTAWSRVVPHGESAWEILITAGDDSTADFDEKSGITLGLYELEHFGTDDQERSEATSLSSLESAADLPGCINSCLLEIADMPTDKPRQRM